MKKRRRRRRRRRRRKATTDYHPNTNTNLPSFFLLLTSYLLNFGAFDFLGPC
jgi:hypothetical protein